MSARCGAICRGKGAATHLETDYKEERRMPTSQKEQTLTKTQEEDMSSSEATTNSDQEAGGLEIPQYNIWMILFMFIWPAALFMFLIHVVVPLF
jgi:hypothetical protein